MTIEKLDIAKIKQTYPIEDVVRGCGVVLCQQGMGERLQAHCPFPNHEDSTPSFVIYRGSRSFRCFGCGVGGDVFDFLQHYHGWSFRQAFDALAGSERRPPLPTVPRGSKTAGVPVPQHSHQHTKLADHRRVFTLATQCYQEELFHHPNVLAYVAERAVSAETTRQLSLGYCDGQRLHTRIKNDLLLSTEARTVGLLTSQGRECLASRLIIPEMREEQAVYLIGRIVPPSRSRHKYLGLATKKPLLGYGEAMRRIRHQDQPIEGMLIVEGALDFVLAWQWQLPVCCVALLSTGASQLQLDEIGELHEHIKDTPVLVGLDADPSGTRSTPMLLSQLQRRGLPAMPVASIQGVKDIGDLGKLPDGREHLLHALSQTLKGYEEVRSP